MRRTRHFRPVVAALLLLALGACELPWPEADKFKAELECGRSREEIADLAAKHHGVVKMVKKLKSGETLVRVQAPDPLPGLEWLVHRDFHFFQLYFVDGHLDEIWVWAEDAPLRTLALRTVHHCPEHE